jgi:hypothetical protein
MLAWGFQTGQWTPASFAAKAAAKGYEWAALEYDDYGNDVRWPSFKAECEAHNIIPGIWVTEGYNIIKTPSDCQFAIAECEGPGDYQGITNAISWGQLPSCSLAVVTNFNTPLTTEAAAKPLIEANFTCLTEAYMNENPQADPDSLNQQAQSLGWPTSQPVFGVYSVNGVPAPSYTQWQDWPGVDYLGEYVIP